MSFRSTSKWFYETFFKFGKPKNAQINSCHQMLQFFFITNFRSRSQTNF